ncbi:MAG: penicillin-binding transpeptidase domain-containing protein [Tissierellia bacterium]|nr:penicillin-binding transpeptidase domain-containing protein [Tissierellia bacterium]
MKKINQFFERLNESDRFSIILVIVAVMMTILLLALGHLTLIKGKYYEDISKNNRVKEVVIKAPRGNIYDREGKVLATTRTSFAATIYKDEFNIQDQEIKNKQLLKLTRILEDEGARFTENYPLQLNMFNYNDLKVFLDHDQDPDEQVIEIIRENHLLPEILRGKVVEKTNYGDYHFYVITRAIDALKSKGLFLDIEKKGSVYVFMDNESTRTALEDRDYAIGDNVYQVVEEFFEEDDASLRKILEHPGARKVAYEIMKKHNVQGDLVLEPMGLLDVRKYIEQKSKLSKIYDNITMETAPKEDFVTIVEQQTLDQLLESAKFNNDNELIVPAQKGIELLKKKGINKYNVKIDESDPSNLKARIFISSQDEMSLNPMEEFIDDLREQEVLKDLICDEDIKYIAQNINIRENINPGISVSEWIYTSLKNYSDFYERYHFEKEPELDDLKEAIFETYDVNDYGDYDRYNLISIYNRLEKQGARRYEGLNIAYNLSERGVAQVEENFEDKSGISVAVEPVRYYPNGTLGSHVLGYLGKIATEQEKDEYLTKKGYKTNALIGKTGVEQSQESALVGSDGYESFLVDSYGNRTELLDKVEAKSGNHVYLTMDLDIQRKTEESLKKTLHSLQTGEIYRSPWGDKYLSQPSSGGLYEEATSAAAVVMDVKTGGILAMASVPSFDPNLFATGISSSDWASLFPKDERNPLAARPLYNIATQSVIQPGSTFKLNSALAALEKGMNPDTTIKCDGYITVGDKNFGCWIWNSYKGTHGHESVREALRDSCNYYFYSLVLGKSQMSNRSLGIELDIEDILKTARKLGLGKRTGIEISTPRESEGTLPDPMIKLSASKNIFRNFLDRHLKNFQKDDRDKTAENIQSDIDQIVSWMDGMTKLSRTEIIERLEELGYESEKIVPKFKASLCDVIKYDYLDQAHWTTADTLNVVIGQGQNAYTPLQMANFMTIFANDGYRVQPTVMEKITTPDNRRLLYENKHNSNRIELKDYDHLQVIREGLKMAANSGSDRLVFNTLPVEIGVKSGTAEVDGKNPETGKDYDNYAWMIGFAPYDDPQIAVATLIVQGGGSANCAPMTRDIIAESLKLYANPNQEEQFEDQEGSDGYGE